MGFSDLEARVNAYCIAYLSNCTATINGGAVISGIFDADYVDALGISGSQPVLMCKTSDAENATQGMPVVIGLSSYTIGSIQPDGRGMTRLMLQEV